jgi:hypothetical protein
MAAADADAESPVGATEADAGAHMAAVDAEAESHVGASGGDAGDALEAAGEADCAVMDGPEWPEGSGRIGEAMFDAEPAAEEVADLNEAGTVDPAIMAERTVQPSVEPPPE